MGGFAWDKNEEMPIGAIGGCLTRPGFDTPDGTKPRGPDPGANYCPQFLQPVEASASTLAGLEACKTWQDMQALIEGLPLEEAEAAIVAAGELITAERGFTRPTRRWFDLHRALEPVKAAWAAKNRAAYLADQDEKFAERT